MSRRKDTTEDGGYEVFEGDDADWDTPKPFPPDLRPSLDLVGLQTAAHDFSRSALTDTKLFGATDGKMIGTVVEHEFKSFVANRYKFDWGNAALGIDFPCVQTDLKTTSAKQPQSSSPYTSLRQKVYGLGHNLLVFIYTKTDDQEGKSGTLLFDRVFFIECEHTGDAALTRILRTLAENAASEETVVGILRESNLQDCGDDSALHSLAREVLTNLPKQGHVTMSSAMQWRLQYGPALELLNRTTEGLERIR